MRHRWQGKALNLKGETDMQSFLTVWKFETARFRVEFAIAYDYGYKYDGDDENGETQAKIDSGEYVAFDSRVRVLLDGRVVGEDHLGGSVYAQGEESEFWTAHRDRDPMNRNCSIMREAKGGNVCICHYFPDMVSSAIGEARKTLSGLPKLRAA